ncbi:2-succinyl-6-hydroxy-2,4-cyclohexadiene-1-carboxylate synthase [Photobacterium jeanii]|uniref:2-succinyl-6-hydroxy-2, 4-cyclohexadiene-1-carboxylate synthase n=1 Tax=Photobacterium jeanii TaxID=858640 RepID=UPI0009FFD03D|nr:2-succinyl-6-hydroxy-2,4-cyclohexadiene-1-carboxylate synthase [Photobacterium jeanii]PST88699.1 2-succinyl-6-hydroxy-2,4-cyclohexadiene-1-carboxylate synthase [Photobacterium jeanii]
MRLYSESFYPLDVQSHATVQSTSRPTLVFLHGLLGNGSDWRQVIDQLSRAYPCLTIDLPGHGHSHAVSAPDFDGVNQSLLQTLVERNVEQYVLVGYSMGARVGMYHAVNQSGSQTPERVKKQPQLIGLVVEGGHFGLPPTERATRFANDQKWAHRFADQPMTDVLSDWYQQPVFSSLDHDQRQSLITKRSDNLGHCVAQMMLATSLAKQPELLAKIKTLTVPFCYLYGERDEKFKCLATAAEVNAIAIADAGHNVHVEQPELFAQYIKEFVKNCC